MILTRRPLRDRWCRDARHADRGAVDVSIQMLFGFMAVLLTMLLIVEATSFWHARNVYDEAASEGARVAAAFEIRVDGDLLQNAAVTANGGGSEIRAAQVNAN